MTDSDRTLYETVRKDNTVTYVSPFTGWCHTTVHCNKCTHSCGSVTSAFKVATIKIPSGVIYNTWTLSRLQYDGANYWASPLMNRGMPNVWRDFLLFPHIQHNMSHVTSRLLSSSQTAPFNLKSTSIHAPCTRAIQGYDLQKPLPATGNVSPVRVAQHSLTPPSSTGH